jgi:FkbM family methyltransferase
LIRAVPFKGRYRVVDKVGGFLGRGVKEDMAINGFLVGLDHDVRQHRMMYYGLYEENSLNFLRRSLKPGDVVVEPGANIGYYSAICSGLVGPTGHVYSFEPSNSAFAQLKRNAEPGGPMNWTLEHAAITDHSGTMTFHDTPRVMRVGYACLEGVAAPADRISHQVEVYSLDDYCARKSITHIAFLKLDIEGSELPALRGAKGLLAAKAIRSILVETDTTPGHRDQFLEVDSILRGAGFRSFIAKRDGSLVPIDVPATPGLRKDVIWTREG